MLKGWESGVGFIAAHEVVEGEDGTGEGCFGFGDGTGGAARRQFSDVIRKWAFPPPPGSWAPAGFPAREIGIRKVGRKWKIVARAPLPLIEIVRFFRAYHRYGVLAHVENIRSTENTNFPFQKLLRPNPRIYRHARSRLPPAERFVRAWSIIHLRRRYGGVETGEG